MIEGANGVQIEVSAEMLGAMCERYNVENVESNHDGLIGTLAGWAKGEGELDAYLCDSPEKRELFAPIRKSYFESKGQEEPAYSNVSWEDRPQPESEKGEDAGEGSEA